MEHIVNNLDNIITLIQTVSESELTSFCYQEGEYSLSMEKTPAGTVLIQEDPEEERNELASETVRTAVGRKKSVGIQKSVQTEKDETPDLQETCEADCVISPMVGTFYSSKAEGGEPLVSVGDFVKAGQTVGIVEAMKLMNEIESPCSGTVMEILAENGRMVEYGQTLIKIKRDRKDENHA